MRDSAQITSSLQRHPTASDNLSEPLTHSAVVSDPTLLHSTAVNTQADSEPTRVEEPPQTVMPCTNSAELMAQINSGQLLMVDRRRRNGLILYKQFHAEFAGPGAAVGGLFDIDCHRVIPVGDLLIATPQSHRERQEAFLIRRQWIKLTQQFTDESVPIKRAQMVLEQFENYFDRSMTEHLPDEAFALLVGVLPQTIRMARRPPNKLNVKAKV